MAKEKIPAKKDGLEKLSRYYRDFNAVVGGMALIGAGVVSPLTAGVLKAYAAFNFGQAGLGELARRYAKRQKKSKNVK